MTARMTTGMGISGRVSNILFAQSDACSIAAEMAAVRPTTRPADRSVPVSTMHPPMPSAMGSEDAARLMMLTMELILMKLALRVAVKMTKITSRM